MKIVIYKSASSRGAIDDFRDNFTDLGLRHFAGELLSYGIRNAAELERAVERAMTVCHAARIPLRANFRQVYTCYNGAMICDWRLSDLARRLVLLNADPDNPFMAKLQIELVTNV